MRLLIRFFFFFNDTATTEIYTLSLHDALPISSNVAPLVSSAGSLAAIVAPSSPSALFPVSVTVPRADRKSTRLNSSHGYISYAVFCLKKKKKQLALAVSHDQVNVHTCTDYCHS